jgi:hypothetical protein
MHAILATATSLAPVPHRAGRIEAVVNRCRAVSENVPNVGCVGKCTGVLLVKPSIPMKMRMTRTPFANELHCGL